MLLKIVQFHSRRAGRNKPLFPASALDCHTVLLAGSWLNVISATCPLFYCVYMFRSPWMVYLHSKEATQPLAFFRTCNSSYPQVGKVALKATLPTYGWLWFHLSFQWFRLSAPWFCLFCTQITSVVRLQQLNKGKADLLMMSAGNKGGLSWFHRARCQNNEGLLCYFAHLGDPCMCRVNAA